jgi:hypothetical protein
MGVPPEHVEMGSLLHCRSRIHATDVLAAFYAKTFGLPEIARPVNSATTKQPCKSDRARP